MGVTWLVPAALSGLVLVSLPVLVHLLARPRSRRRLFPSLRFVEPSPRAARRRRAVEDWPLLAVRMLMVAAAVAALAAPVFDTVWRRADREARVVRAVVVEGSAATSTPTFARERLGDAIGEAVRWLQAQPPARRELVVRAAFRVGQLSPGELAVVPPEVGITLERVDAAASPRDIDVPILRLEGDAPVRTSAAVRLASDATTIIEGATRPMPAWPLRVMAAPTDRVVADAALRAVLDAGVRWPFADGEPVVVAWTGAGEAALLDAKAAGARVIAMEAPRDARDAAPAVRHAIARVLPPLDRHEPERIPPERLAAWSRPAGPPVREGPPRDEGDRRWLWSAVLALAAVEHALRRRPPAQVDEAAGEAARVA